MSLFRSLAFVAALCALDATLLAQQREPQTASAADVELWAAALSQIAREKQPQALALLNETLTVVDFPERLTSGTSEPVLVNKLLQRNRSPLVISSNVKPSVELVDAPAVRKRGSPDLDMDAIRERFGQQRRRLVRLSLPVFSDDGSRALICTWTAGGFNDASGGGYVFERRQGQWVIVGYLAAWIT